MPSRLPFYLIASRVASSAKYEKRCYHHRKLRTHPIPSRDIRKPTGRPACSQRKAQKYLTSQQKFPVRAGPRVSSALIRGFSYRPAHQNTERSRPRTQCNAFPLWLLNIAAANTTGCSLDPRFDRRASPAQTAHTSTQTAPPAPVLRKISSGITLGVSCSSRSVRLRFRAAASAGSRSGSDGSSASHSNQTSKPLAEKVLPAVGKPSQCIVGSVPSSAQVEAAMVVIFLGCLGSPAITNSSSFGLLGNTHRSLDAEQSLWKGF